jgi:hypothetical protein
VWLLVPPGPSQTNPKKKNNTRTHPGGYLVLRSYLPYIGGSHRMCCSKETSRTLEPKKKNKEKPKTRQEASLEVKI